MPAWVPGLTVALLIALAALGWDGRTHWLNGVIIAIVAGAVLGNMLPGIRSALKPGIDFALKKLLRVVIILMGLQFSLAAAVKTGGQALAVILVSVLLGLTVAYAIGRAFGLNRKLALLIGAGTSICGATAIATVAPILDAEDQDVALSIATVFLFNTMALLVYPVIGSAIGLTDQAFGTWVGTAVHDTSAVLATGFAYSEQAGLVGTVVKLTRTIMIVPLAAAFAIGAAYQGAKKTGAAGVLKGFPWFILGFLALSVVNTLGFASPEMLTFGKTASKLLVAIVMASVGLSLDFAKLKVTGFRFLYTGFAASAVVGVVSLMLIYLLGIH
jgi:uncharacterized integral membrane protein (TIGR00698 family)